MLSHDNNVRCSLSVIAGDLSDLKKVVTQLDNSSCDYIHLDVMDGHFVPNLTFGFQTISFLRGLTKKFFDTHLMISNPGDYIDKYIAAGSDIISIHVEAADDVVPLLKHIRKSGKKASLAFNPDTPIDDIEKFFPHIDQVLMMSVHPGFAGQKFIEKTFKRVLEVRRKMEDSGYAIDIEVDGGVNGENASLLKKNGANVLVVGSFALSPHDQDNERIEIALKAMRED